MVYEDNLKFSSKEKKCWIVCHETFEVKRVTATYDNDRMKWSYIEAKDDITVFPYFPTMGNGNKSYWGDGPKFKTKKIALEEQKRVLKKELMLAQKEAKRAIEKTTEYHSNIIKELKRKLK